MSMYVVLNNKYLNKKELERFENDAWENTSRKMNPEKYEYFTDSVDDEKLLSYNFTKIIWNRVRNPFNKTLEKVIIDFEPDNFLEMKRIGEEKTEEKKASLQELYKDVLSERDRKYDEKKQKERASEKYKYNLENLINQININDQILDENDDDMSAMAKWKKSGFIMPAPHKISQLKKSYSNITWKQFIAIVNELIKDEPEVSSAASKTSLYTSLPNSELIHTEPDPEYK